MENNHNTTQGNKYDLLWFGLYFLILFTGMKIAALKIAESDKIPFGYTVLIGIIAGIPAYTIFQSTRFKRIATKITFLIILLAFSVGLNLILK